MEERMHTTWKEFRKDVVVKIKEGDNYIDQEEGDRWYLKGWGVCLPTMADVHFFWVGVRETEQMMNKDNGFKP